jgi:hypothetical protein
MFEEVFDCSVLVEWAGLAETNGEASDGQRAVKETA